MHYQRGKDRDQVFMTSLSQMVEQDSWARVVDFFVAALPITELGFTHSNLNKEGNLPYRVKGYATPHCTDCPVRQDCTVNAYGRFIERPAHQAYTDRNDSRVRRYPDFYRTRQEIIEHVLGTWKRHWGMTHSVVKGKQKVEAEYRLTAICYNLMRSLSILGLEKLKMNIKTSLAAYMAAIRSFLSCFERLFTSQSLTFIMKLTDGRRAV